MQDRKLGGFCQAPKADEAGRQQAVAEDLARDRREKIVDEREVDSRAREERAPPLTGRQKDGVFKVKAAARAGKKPPAPRGKRG